MKLKVFLTLLFLTGSAFSQLIPIKEESGFLSSYRSEKSLFTLIGDGSSMPYPAPAAVRASLSFRDDPSATPAIAENPRFGAGLQGDDLLRFAMNPVPDTTGAVFSDAATFAAIDADSRTPSDSFPTHHDEGVLALIAATTIP